MIVRPYLMTFFLMFSLNIFGQSIQEKVTRYFDRLQIEKVYAGHDKPYYVPGETIWCKIYLVDGRTHIPFSGTAVVYAEWIDPAGKVVQSYTLQVINGTATLDITTDTDDPTGGYTLRVYSQYQRNFDPHYFFQKEIRLLDTMSEAEDARLRENELAVNFFPEGGDLVSGLENTIAFKAENALGDPVIIEGTIFDQDGRKITGIKTLHEGIGLFKLRPERGRSYTLRIEDRGQEREFALPAVLKEGYLLNVDSRSQEHILLSLRSNRPELLAGATLLGHIRGQIFYAQTLSGDSLWQVAFSKQELPSGIVHFTLFDARQRPVCERLVFNKSVLEQVEVVIETDKSVYKPKEPVKLTFLAKSLQSTVRADLSVSVFNDIHTTHGPGQLNLVNYLLLQSDLRGPVRNIQQYFAEDSPKVNALLDLLLLTHGWRRFRWQNVLAESQPQIHYPREQHLTIAGKVSRAGQQKAVQADVMLNVLSADQFTALNLTTSENGLFYFKGFDFRDTTDLLIQANLHNPRQQRKLEEGEIRRAGSKYVDIELLEPDAPPFDSSFSFPFVIYQENQLRQYAYEVEQTLRTDSFDESIWTIDLETVTVRSGLNRAQLREQEIQKRFEEKGLFYFGNTQKFLADDPAYAEFLKNNVFDLIRRIVPGTTLSRENGRQEIFYGRFSKRIKATILMDGRKIVTSFLDSIDPDDIAVIEVLEDPYASAYSDDPVVISLVSKNPGEKKIKTPGIITLSHPGYYQAREFYSPAYTSAISTTEKQDFRTTLFWDPKVSMDGVPVERTFFTGDRPGFYRIVVEGITAGGVPFIHTQRIEISN